MFAAQRKIKKANDAKPDNLERKVAQAVFDLEVNDAELRAELQFLSIRGATQIEVGKNKTAIVVFVPVRQLKGWHKIQGKVVRELEKKFSGQQIIVLGDRKSHHSYKSAKHRPMARTRKIVEENLLEDLVFPVAITGKRMRVKLDGSVHYKVFLDAKEKANFGTRTRAFSVVYKKLTGKNVKFEFISA